MLIKVTIRYVSPIFPYSHVSQNSKPQIGRICELYFTKLWDFVKNREIFEISLVFLLLWIECINKSVIYFNSLNF